MSIIGDRLRHWRTVRGISPQELGRALGHRTGRYIYAIESGEKYPGPAMLAKIADVLSLKPGDLTGEKSSGSL